MEILRTCGNLTVFSQRLSARVLSLQEEIEHGETNAPPGTATCVSTRVYTKFSLILLCPQARTRHRIGFSKRRCTPEPRFDMTKKMESFKLFFVERGLISGLIPQTPPRSIQPGLLLAGDCPSASPGSSYAALLPVRYEFVNQDQRHVVHDIISCSSCTSVLLPIKSASVHRSSMGFSHAS